MTEFDRPREEMVKFQLSARGIGDPRVLNAFRIIPRELFLPKEYRDLSYVDGPVPIGDGQTISQPYTVAVMTGALKPASSDRVLEIGAGSGYQAAILGCLVSRVFTVERIPALSRRAERVLADLGFKNVDLRVGDGTKGWPDFAKASSGKPEAAPFDKIVVTAAARAVPQALFDQLKVGGILVAPVGPPEAQELVRYTKKETGLNQEFLGVYRFVPLIGA